MFWMVKMRVNVINRQNRRAFSALKYCFVSYIQAREFSGGGKDGRAFPLGRKIQGKDLQMHASHFPLFPIRLRANHILAKFPVLRRRAPVFLFSRPKLRQPPSGRHNSPLPALSHSLDARQKARIPRLLRNLLRLPSSSRILRTPIFRGEEALKSGSQDIRFERGGICLSVGQKLIVRAGS